MLGSIHTFNSNKNIEIHDLCKNGLQIEVNRKKFGKYAILT